MEGYSDRDYLNPKRKLGTIKWDTIKDDLKYLLNHSDCDGHITPLRCKKIADRLSSLLEGKKIPEDIFSSTEGLYLVKTKKFRDGCLRAYNKKQKLEFH